MRYYHAKMSLMFYKTGKKVDKKSAIYILINAPGNTRLVRRGRGAFIRGKFTIYYIFAPI
jgi:hypothetical protein